MFFLNLTFFNFCALRQNIKYYEMDEIIITSVVAGVN